MRYLEAIKILCDIQDDADAALAQKQIKSINEYLAKYPLAPYNACHIQALNMLTVALERYGVSKRRHGQDSVMIRGDVVELPSAPLVAEAAPACECTCSGYQLATGNWSPECRYHAKYKGA